MTSTVLCTFVVGDLLLGLPVHQVSEVVLGGDVTEVPLAPPAVLGLLNLRGRILPAVDLRVPLGLPPGPGHADRTHVVVTGAGEPVSLVVDAASDVVDLADADLDEVPDTVSPAIRRLLTAAYQAPAGLLLVLDPALVLAHTSP